MVVQQLADLRRRDGAAAERDDGRAWMREHSTYDSFLDVAERRLPFGEELGDRPLLARLDDLVDVLEQPVQPARDLLAERRLARRP